MTLYVKLDSHIWILEDYTDEDSLGITGTVYSDDAMTTAFDITGYTLTIRIKAQGKIKFDSDQDSNVSAIVAADGTFRYKPEIGDLLLEANGEVSLLMEKTGTQITAIGLNGSADLHIQLA